MKRDLLIQDFSKCWWDMEVWRETVVSHRHRLVTEDCRGCKQERSHVQTTDVMGPLR